MHLYGKAKLQSTGAANDSAIVMDLTALRESAEASEKINIILKEAASNGKLTEKQFIEIEEVINSIDGKSFVTDDDIRKAKSLAEELKAVESVDFDSTGELSGFMKSIELGT
jgi:hypothetical protein